jgi:hypothetical protein
LRKTIAALVGMVVVVLAASPARAEPPQPDVKETVEKGLTWLARQQEKDGSWSENGQFRGALTALAGTALLMEGSTPRAGRYSGHLRKAVDWFLENAQPNGLVLDPMSPGDHGRYMYAHGYGLLFLASVHGEEADLEQQKRLDEVLRKAIAFAVRAQAKNGGWGYVAAAEGNDNDEAIVRVAVLQGLCAAQRTGLAVPRSTMDRAAKNLQECTNREGGIPYSGRGGEGRPVATAGALACAVMGGDAQVGSVKAWCEFARKNPDSLHGVMNGYLYHYYFARVVYSLGEEGHRQLIPGVVDKDRLLWSRYRMTLFSELKKGQAKDGVWGGSEQYSLLNTALALTILQLETNALPVFSR